MKIVFFGSSKYSAIDAQKLHDTLGLRAVVTIPDRKIGRKQVVTPSPVKQFADIHKIPTITTDVLTPEVIQKIAAFEPDFLVVADYGLILPPSLLTIPKIAPLNVHHSLLPEYRGSSPAQTAILNGESTTGVSIIVMADKMDAGDIVAQEQYVLKPTDTTDSLLTTLNTIGSTLVTDAITQWEEKVPLPQDELLATYTKQITKEDGYIDMANPPEKAVIERMTRAYYPWPGVWGRIKIPNHKSQTTKIIKFLPNQIVQLEGKKPVSYKEFLNGYPELQSTLEKVL